MNVYFIRDLDDFFCDMINFFTERLFINLSFYVGVFILKYYSIQEVTGG